MTESDWWKYVERLIGDDNALEAGRRAGFDSSAFTRWRKGGAAAPDFAVKLARAYGANVLEALVAAGTITAEEAALREVAPNAREVLREASEDALASEVLRRMKLVGDHAALTTPVDELVDGAKKSADQTKSRSAVRTLPRRSKAVKNPVVDGQQTGDVG